MIEFSDFERVEIRVGTVVSAELNPKARQPAYVLEVDFGPLGVRTSSAQITEHYEAGDLVGSQVAAVLNVEPKRIAGVKSEVLILASVGDSGTVLLSPTQPVLDGSRVA